MKGRAQLMASARDAGTSASDDWCTPPTVLARVRLVGPIALDPCTSADNPTRAASWSWPPANGLALSWLGCSDGGLIFMNPPYSTAAAWATKAAAEAEAGCEIISLIAARPDSRWFSRLVWDSAQAVCFWRGRLRFVGAPASAPFPSALVYHGRRPWVFEGAFADAGRVVRL
jgi:phage N-6-adenine-methyltransferase